MYDPDTKLVRFGARDYNPRLGRWMTKDPIRFGGGTNFYAYSSDDPVNRDDTSGKEDVLLCMQVVPFGNFAELAACMMTPPNPYREPGFVPDDCDAAWH
ncbi:MAG: RHS repeat-associated core domain-containing protein, partial [Polyangiaceae bacterium]